MLVTTEFKQSNVDVRNDADLMGSPAVLVTGSNVILRNSGYLDNASTGAVLQLSGGGTTFINEAEGNVGSDFFRSTIVGSDYAETIIDCGHIRGRVELGGGDDVYVACKSSAEVSFGAGNDRFDFTAGEDYIEMYNLSLRLTGGPGKDTLNLTGTGLKLSPIVRDFEVLNVSSTLAYLNNFSNFSSINLAPNGFYEFAYSSNPSVDLDLKATLSLRGSSSLHSITGSEGQQELKLSGNVQIGAGVQLGAGTDFVMVSYGSDPGAPQFEGQVDGGIGSDQLSFINGSDTFLDVDLSPFRSFETIMTQAVGGFEFRGLTDAKTMHLSNDALFTFNISAVQLDVVANSGQVQNGFGSVLGSITGPGGQSNLPTTSSLSVVNDGNVISDVRMSDGNDRYLASGIAGGTVYGFGGDDLIVGGVASDRFNGGSGDDVIRPGTGRDIVDGGDGKDILELAAAQLSVSIAQDGDHIVVVSGSDAVRINNIEQVRFGNGVTGAWADVVASTARFDALSYIASYSDLRAAFGTDATAGTKHFIESGFAEGRALSFNALDYIASYGDLRQAFGADATAGAQHFIQSGANENRRVSFSGWTYLASYGDLIQAYGANKTAAAQHFIQFGAAEGRTTSFDATAYAAANADLAVAFGTDQEALARHYVQFGYAEGRTFASGAPAPVVAALAVAPAEASASASAFDAAFVTHTLGQSEPALFASDAMANVQYVSHATTDSCFIA